MEKLEQPEEPAQAETPRQMPTLPIAKIEKMEEPAQAKEDPTSNPDTSNCQD